MFNDSCLPHLVQPAKMANIFKSTYIENWDVFPFLYTSWYSFPEIRSTPYLIKGEFAKKFLYPHKISLAKSSNWQELYR